MVLPRPPKFRPKQAIVCINDDFKALLSQIPTIRTPLKDATVYTVRDVYWVASLNVYAITLNEIHNDPVFDERVGHYEPSWNESRFAPVEELGDWESYVNEEIKELLQRDKEILV